MESVQPHEPWNKGKLVGQKPPLKLKDISASAIRIQMQFGKRVRTRGLTSWPQQTLRLRRGCGVWRMRLAAL